MKKFSLLYLLLAITSSASAYDDPVASGFFFHDFQLEDIAEYNVDASAGTVTLLVKNEVDEMAFNAQFYVENGELAAGEYPINGSKQPGTVQKGYIDGAAFMMPTFCAQTTEDGYYLIPAWICDEGSVTVSFDANGQIVLAMNAMTSAGGQVTVTVNAQGLSLDEIEAGQALTRPAVDLQGHPAPADAHGLVIENGRVVLRK